MVIYTRTGDKGQTSLLSGIRVSKADLRVETYGTIDELNSLIGGVLSMKYLVSSIKKELIRIQKDLLSIGSTLANPDPKYSIQNTKYFSTRIIDFENFIDEMTEKLPPLKNFVLPGGGKAGSMLHLSRTVCRRAERRIVALNNKEKIDTNIIIYFNRLSDLLFTMARFTNFKEKKKEIIWPA
jgi:cob(I)alamin adenosyltransferase